MSQNHPIDDLFNRKLSEYSSEPPMHLWDKIDQKRDWKHKLLNQIRLHKQSLLVVSSLLLLLCAWQFIKPVSPTLGHFPVLVQEHFEFEQLVVEDEVAPSISAVEEVEKEPSIVAHTQNTANTTPPRVVKAAQQLTSVLQEKENTTTDKANLNEAVQEKTADVVAAKLPVDEPVIEDLEDDQVGASPVGLKVATLPPLETLEFSLEENRLFGLFNPDPKCAKFKHGQWFLYLDMMASPDIPIRSLKARNSLYNSYVMNREQTESLEFSYSAAFRLSAVSNIGLAIRTGLNYTQINEQFNYYNENEERIIIDNIYGPGGEIIGSDTTIVAGVRHKVTHNKFQIVDLPIILGYEMEFKKFIVNFNAGPHINLYFESEGDFLSPELEPVSFSSDDPDGIRAFRNHLGIGWYTSVGLQYRLNSRINLLVEPYFKMYPKGFTRSQYMVEQQYLSTGFSIGIRQKI